MLVKIKYFAKLRDDSGISSEQIETNANTIEQLYQELDEKYHFSVSKKYLRAARNEDYVNFDTRFKDNDTIVFYSTSGRWLMFSITSDNINNLNELNLEITKNPSVGGIVYFQGVVRDHNDGKDVSSLEYESYESMAVKVGASIVKEAIEKFGIESAYCIHKSRAFRD